MHQKIDQASDSDDFCSTSFEASFSVEIKPTETNFTRFFLSGNLNNALIIQMALKIS